MAQDQTRKKNKQQKPLQQKTAVPSSDNNWWMSVISYKIVQVFIICVIGVIFYSNSISNGFATDDNEYYFNNQFVQRGLDGIPNLLTKESMFGYFANSSIVTGGRWRPLSLITFALEKEFFEANPHYSHLINLLILLITGVIMLFFLRKYIFKDSPLLAFTATLLFIIHPVHTEAVAHIKSRDELFSWLFLLLTTYCSLNFLNRKNYWQLFFSVVFFALALLSKENGITFIAILPLTFYFFSKARVRAMALTMLPLIAVLGIYGLLRHSIVTVKANAGSDIINAPYSLATPVQHLATALMVLSKYIILLFYPNPLSCDYTYGTISYVDFSDWRVWASILIQTALVIYAFIKIKEKSIIAYGILFYFCSIFVVSNIFVDVGTFVGERFLYQPSFGFCIAIVAAVNALIGKLKFKNFTQKFYFISVLMVIIVVLSGFQTINRNTLWKDNKTIWSMDLAKEPNSIMLHENLGAIYMNEALDSHTAQECKDDFAKALVEDDSAIVIYPKYSITWFNLGYLYLLMHNDSAAQRAFVNCIRSDSTYSQGYNGVGTVYYKAKEYQKALPYFIKGAKLDSLNAQFYYNIGLCYFDMGQYENAIEYYKKTLTLLSNLQDMREKILDPGKVEQNLLDAENKLANNNR